MSFDLGDSVKEMGDAAAVIFNGADSFIHSFGSHNPAVHAYMGAICGAPQASLQVAQATAVSGPSHAGARHVVGGNQLG
jgi:hypothetical protein